MIDLRLLGDFARRRWWVFALTGPVLIVLLAPASETLGLYHLLSAFVVVGGLTATSLDYLIGGGSLVLATLPVRRRSLANSLYLMAAVLPATAAAAVFLAGIPLIGLFRPSEARPTDVLISTLASVAFVSVFLLLINRARSALSKVSLSPGFFIASQTWVYYYFIRYMLKGELLGFSTAWMLWPAVAVGTVAAVMAWWRMPFLLVPSVERVAGQRGLDGRWNRGWSAWRPSRSTEVFLLGLLFAAFLALPLQLLGLDHPAFTFFALWIALAGGSSRVFGHWLSALRTLRQLPLTAGGLSLIPLREMVFLTMGWGIAGGVILGIGGHPSHFIFLLPMPALQLAGAMLAVCFGLRSGVNSRSLLIVVGLGIMFVPPVLLAASQTVLLGWWFGEAPVTLRLVLGIAALVALVVSIGILAIALSWMPALLRRASSAYRSEGLGRR